MKIGIFVAAVLSILERIETAPTNSELLAAGTEVNELEAAKDILLFSLYKPLLDAMKKVYDISLFVEELGKMSFDCFIVSQNEVTLKSFNSILSSFLYKTEMETIEKTKLPATSSREFYSVEMPLYIRIIDKFLNFLPTTWEEMSNFDHLSTVIEGARAFAKGLHSNNECVNQARACSAIIARIERNQELFVLYLSGVRAILVDVFEKVGCEIAADPRAAIIVSNKLQSSTNILEKIKNHRVFVEPNGEIYDLENYDKELGDEGNDDPKRQRPFNFKNVVRTAVTASPLTAVLMSAIKSFQSFINYWTNVSFHFFSFINFDCLFKKSNILQINIGQVL